MADYGDATSWNITLLHVFGGEKTYDSLTGLWFRYFSI